MAAHKARKRFGQHFLNDQNILSQIAQQAALGNHPCIVEIGPGQGALTEHLLMHVPHLTAIELDRDLVSLLRERYSEDRLNLISSDILNIDLSALAQELGREKLALVGNLPYNISTPLIFHLLQHHPVVGDMVFMLQQEVAQRLLATPGSKQWGRLSVMSQRIVHCEHLISVPPEAFTPPPKVMSSVIRLSIRADIIPVKSEADLTQIVQAAFSQRRKTIRNSLKTLLSESQIEQCGVNPTDRPERISVKQFIQLADTFSDSEVAH